MHYVITHKTRYTGNEPVSVGHNQAWLKPRDLPTQDCRWHRLTINPKPSCRTERIDYFGNDVVDFSFNRGYETLTVTAKSRVTMIPQPLPSHDESLSWEIVRDSLIGPAASDSPDDVQFRFASPLANISEEFRDYGRESFSEGRPLLSAVADLTSRIHRDFTYQPLSTTVSTPVKEVFHNRRGVCQDFAHLEIAVLRSLGLAARYVSGYVRTHPPPGQPRLVGADASHAWLSVWCGDLGWIDVDPTNDRFSQDEHITVAWGRDYGDVAPLRGVFIGGGLHSLEVSVDVVEE